MLFPLLRYLSLLSTLLVMSCGTCLAANFYYFNPDSPQSNLARLKSGMDDVLRANGMSLSFQPFARLRDFDRLVKENKPAVIIAPTWYLQHEGKNLGLQVILRPRYQGSSYYHKVLLVPNSSNPQVTLLDRTIAMTSMGQGNLEMLNKLIFANQDLNSQQLTIVTTTKDLDALFALALRQVDAAFVSEQNLNSIKKINPRIARQVKIIARSSPIPLPELYVNKDMAANEIAKLKAIFINQRQHAAKLLEMLQIDDWQDLTQ